MFKLTWLKKIILWAINADSNDKDFTLKSSITGAPLLKVSKRGSLYQTKEGMTGAHTSVLITQFGSDIGIICDVLRGNRDYCLSNDDKQKIIRNIEKRVSEGGRYLATVRNKKGNLDFVDRFWDKKEIDTIRNLLGYCKDGR